MFRFRWLLLITNLLFILSGCSTTYDNNDTTTDSVMTVETNQNTIAQYKVNGCTTDQKNQIYSIVDKTTAAMNETSSLEVATVSTDKDLTDYVNAVYDASGIAELLKYGEEYIQYTDVEYVLDDNDPKTNVTIQTYAGIYNDKVVSYQLLSSAESEGTWLESDMKYKDPYSFGLLVSKLKTLNEKNLSLYEDDKLYYIAANLKLYDYYCYQPVQLSYSQDLANMIATEDLSIPIVFSIDKDNYLISATFAENVNYSNLDSTIQTEKGNEFNIYYNYNALSQIQVPKELNLDKVKN